MTEEDAQVLATLTENVGKPGLCLLKLPAIQVEAESDEVPEAGPREIRKLLASIGAPDPILMMAQLAYDPAVKVEARVALAKELASYIHAKRQNIQVTGNINHRHLVRFIAPELCTKTADWQALAQGQQAPAMKPMAEILEGEVEEPEEVAGAVQGAEA